MSDLNLYMEIVKNLDYSNTSKDRLQQLVQQRDQRIVSALTSFVRERERASQDSQKHMAMVQLKKELDVVLFGKSTTDYQVGTYTTTTTNLYTTNLTGNAVPSISTNGTSNLSYVPYQTGTSNVTYTQTYGLPQTNVYTTSTNTNSLAPSYNQTQTKMVASNSNSGNDDYIKNLLAQQQRAVQNNPPPIQKSPMSGQNSNYSGDDVVKRAARKGEPTEYDHDNRVENIRNNRKANKEQVTKVSTDLIKKEQMRLKVFKEKWTPDQPLVPELYKLFYDTVDDLDFASFLSLRHKLHLDDISVKELIKTQQEILKSQLNNKTSGINPVQFLTLMNASSLNEEDVFYLLQIFFYLDFNNNGLLDADEILLGFVMLSNASEKEKLEAAFQIVDEDGSGTLDIQEMTTYMRSVIRMGDGRKFHSNDAFEHEFLIEKMAAATAQGIFKEMDMNLDGRISYEEFIVWHNIHGSDIEGIKEEQQQVQNILTQAKKDRTQKLLKFNAFTLQNEDYQKITNDRLQQVLDSKLNETSINNFRQKLQLGEIKFLDAVHYLKEFKISERLGFGAFYQFMKDLYSKCSVKIDINNVKNELTEFYGAIDIDSNGFVDWNEILGAFSLLCTGTENEKIKGIFDVFDMNGDNILQFHEIYTLFLSSFNLIFMRNPDAEIARQDPSKLAFSMALSAFSDNSLDPYTNGLDIDTFTSWYKKFDLI